MSQPSKLRHVLSVGGLELEAEIDNTEGQAVVWDEDVADSETDYEIAGVIDISQLKAIMIVAVGGDMTLETNDGAAPSDAFSLLDGVPRVWSVDYLALAGIFTVDITAWFLTNASGATSTFKCIAIIDPTV